MAVSTETIRKITIQGDGQQSLDSLKSSLDGVSAAQAKLSGVSNTAATVTDMVTKRALSAEAAYKRQTLAVVDGARAADQLARSLKVVDAALQQGRISAQEHADRVALLQQKYGDAGNASKTLSTATAGLSNAFGAARGVIAAFGISLGVAALVQYGKQIFSTTADLQEQADQILGAGGNVEALQAFRGIFLTNGIAMEAGDKIITKLTRSLGEAAQGSKQAQDAFHLLGLGSKELAGSTADAALPLVAQKLLDIKSASERATIETTLFGKSGQQLESALSSLAHPLDDLIAHAKNLGIVIDADMIKKADDAKDRMALAWMKLSVSLAPIITNWVYGFVKFADSIDGSAKAIGGLIQKIQILGGAYAGLRIGGAVGGLPGAIAGGVIGGVGTSLATTDRTTQLNGLIANDQLRLQQTNLDPAIRASLEARIQRNIATVNASVGNTRLVERPGGNSNDLLQGGDAKNPPWKPTTEDLAAYAKIKETFAGYLDELKQAADVSKLSAGEKLAEDNVIKAAVIDEKAHGVAARVTSKNYESAKDWLGAANVERIRALTFDAQIAALTQKQSDQHQIDLAALGATADTRDLIIQKLQLEQQFGDKLTDDQKAQLAVAEKNLDVHQQLTDSTRTKDYLDDLKEQASLAGMSADERERESAVLQVMHMNNGQITDDLANQVRGAIGLRQEMQKVGQVSDTIQSGFEDFFANVLSGGKNAFGQLVDIIKQQFIKLLAYMAAQAIAQPIIVPIIGAITGAVGLGGLAGAAGGVGGIGNIFGSLGTVSSAGSLAGSSGFLGGIGSQISSAASWLTNGINSIGSSLGFSAGTSFGGISTVGVTPSVFGAGGFAAPNIAGSSSLLGGTTLSGLLGGAGLGLGVGSLVGSLTGGNSLGSSIGGALGGAIGSVVPVIGTILGSALGGAIGGLFGPGKTAGKASATFDANGVITGYGGDKATDKSSQAVQSAAQTISQTVQTLEAAGLQINNSISKLVIADNRDKSFIITGDGQQQTVGKVGDANSAIQGTLDYLLKGMSSADAEVQKVITHYQALGGITSDNADQFASDVQFAKSLESLSFDTTKQLSQTQQAMQDLNTQFQTAIDKAKSLGLDITNIVNAQASALKAIRDQFNQSIQDQLQQLVGPITYQFDQLIAAQKQRLSDAQAIGADISKVDALNKAEIANALQSYKDAVTQAQSDLASAQGKTIALTVSQAQSELDQAYNSQASNLNSTISQFTGIAQNLRQAVSQIAASFGGSLTNTAGVTRQQFLSAVSGAKSGNIDAYNSLPQNAQAYLQAIQQTASTPAQFAMAQAQVRSALEDAAKSADTQVSVAQKQLDALNKQVAGLVAVNDNVISIAQGIADLNAAQASQVSLAQAALATAQANLAEAQSVINNGAVNAATAAAIAAASSAATAAQAASTTPAQISSGVNINTTLDEVRKAYFSNGIKTAAFANGGNFGGGWRLVGERGPEIENTGPSNIISNSNSRNLFDASGIISELRAVKSELASLRAEQGKAATKTADSTKKTADILRRVTRDGNSLVTEAA